MRIEERLRAISAEIKDLQTELAILDEQVEFQADIAEDARIRAMVSETPLADREARQARQDLERLSRSRAEAAERIEDLRGEQDQLLEQLTAQGR